MKVYLLQHSYEYEISDGVKVTNAKAIGIYDSWGSAEKVKQKYMMIQGFKRFPEDCFYINVYELNEGQWLDGFITYDKGKGRQKYDIPKKLSGEKLLLKKTSDEEAVKRVLEEKNVYFFQHGYEYEEDVDVKLESNKVIGIYSSREEAEAVKEQLKIKPGFSKYPEDCFFIDRYRLNEDHWTEGFITWDDEADSWIE